MFFLHLPRLLLERSPEAMGGGLMQSISAFLLGLD